MSRPRRLLLTLLASGVAAVLAACGSTMPGTGRPAEVDVRQLDTGMYPIEPRDAHDDYTVPLSNRLHIATMRLADHVATATDIDPKLRLRGHAGGFSGDFIPNQMGAAEALKAVAQQHRMLFGFESEGSDSTAAVILPGIWPVMFGEATSITSSVMQFPDSAAAEQAAKEFQQADFDAQEGRNQLVALPNYPAVQAHWQPGRPMLRSWAAHGSYVVGFLVTTPQPDLDALVTLAHQAYDVQLPLLDQLEPLSDEAALRLPWDPDGLLNRALNPNQQLNPSDDSQAVYGPRGLLHFLWDRGNARERLAAMGADRFGISDGTIVARTHNATAAKKVVADRTTPDPTLGTAESPANVPDSTCVENDRTEYAFDISRFTCIVAYRQYVGFVSADQILDAHQRAAAQYALFANAQ